MDNVLHAVMEALPKAGLVQVEVSARHVHLSEEDFEILFGKGASLTMTKELSQPGQFLSKERVCLEGPKGRKENVAILGPYRPNTQVELSRSDCIALGVDAPLRESGDIKGSAGIKIIGPAGSLEIKEGVIVALNHLHVPNDMASELNLRDKQRINVKVFSDRRVTFRDVIVRVNKNFSFRMHIDFDEANAAWIKGSSLGLIEVN